mgnify:CR=1 FL=1
MSKVKISPFWKFLFFFLGSVVVAMVIVINSVIGGFSWMDSVCLAASTVLLQVSVYSQPSDYTVRLQLYIMISENGSS